MSNSERLREGFAAMNREDVDWLVEHSAPDIEMHMRGVAGEPVLYTGHDGIREYFRDMAEIWESVEFTPEEVHDLGERVFAIVRQRARGRASGIEVDALAGVVCEFRDGKVTEMRSYFDVEEALADAGLER